MSTSPKAAAEFWESASLHRDAIVAKIKHLPGMIQYAMKLDECRRSVTNLNCLDCSTCITFRNRCDRKWCPLCTPRLSFKRAEKVRHFVRGFRQPKHVVLTQRNSTSLDREFVVRHKRAVSRLRRTKFTSNWNGGFQNTEVTNEGQGWHLHTHLLIDARWIDASTLAQTWAKLVGQEFAIVKVKDARDSNYLAELTKYVAKSSQVASWSADDIADFIQAFDRVRTWHCFGSLNGMTASWKARENATPRPTCECGRCNWRPTVTYAPEPKHA